MSLIFVTLLLFFSFTKYSINGVSVSLFIHGSDFRYCISDMNAAYN